MSWCECSPRYGCGRVFGGLTGFDAHLIGSDRRCATDEELTAKGYAQDRRGWWRSISLDARFVSYDSTQNDAEAASG